MLTRSRRVQTRFFERVSDDGNRCRFPTDLGNDSRWQLDTEHAQDKSATAILSRTLEDARRNPCIGGVPRTQTRGMHTPSSSTLHHRMASEIRADEGRYPRNADACGAGCRSTEETDTGGDRYPGACSVRTRW